MPEFAKPAFAYDYDSAAQIRALRRYRDTAEGRKIPRKNASRLLLATWNIANLGAQDRRDADHALLAEVIGWFDLVAVQEVKQNLAGLLAIRDRLPKTWRLVFSDAGGNRERAAFLYDSRKLDLLEEIAEVAVPPSEIRNIAIKGSQQKFEGFDRNPHVASFRAAAFRFSVANVHLYFGSESRISMNRRALEALAVARWAHLRQRSPDAYTPDVMLIGDFNLPKCEPGDPIFDALDRYGLHLPLHSSRIGSSIAADAHYDQLAFFPGHTAEQFTGAAGVFDFDGAVFADLWATRGRKDFLAYLRYYLSDHRPLWAQLLI